MDIIQFVNTYISTPALCGMMVFSGVFFGIKTRVYSPKRLFSLGKTAFSDAGEGGVSPVSALFIALAGTLGVGNIVGVAVAVSLGGAGAVFWMLLSAFIGCALKYAEASLAVKYRLHGKDGYYGGAPYYIRAGTNSAFAARLYAAVAVLSSLFVGCVIQVNSAACAAYDTCGVPPICVGAAFAVLCGVIIFGGVGRVSAFINGTLPIVSAIYLGLSFIAVCMRADALPEVICRIFTEAFSFKSAAFGIGGTLFVRGMRHGFAKGVLSHEAGCGTSAFSHASANVKSPESQGFFGCVEVFVDTFIFGGLTALVILLSPAGSAGADAANAASAYDGTALTMVAYSYYFGAFAEYILTALIIFFAFATILAQAFYGVRAVSFLKPSEKLERAYTAVFCVMLAAGSVVAPRIMWELSDFSCALLLVLNCVCMLRMYRAVPVLPDTQHSKKPLTARPALKNKRVKRSR